MSSEFEDYEWKAKTSSDELIHLDEKLQLPNLPAASLVSLAQPTQTKVGCLLSLACSTARDGKLQHFHVAPSQQKDV